MNRICVATSKAGAYYTLVSRLRRSELQFESMLPESDSRRCDLILTTAEEAPRFGRKAVPLEELDEDPGVFKGQIVSRLNGEEVVLVGVDPGKHSGLAVFYGQTALAFNTFDSVTALCSRIGAFAAGLPGRRFVVRIGNGDKAIAARVSESVKRLIPKATVEIVNEAGTSVRSAKLKGAQGDQVAAAKIAFRRGVVVS